MRASLSGGAGGSTVLATDTAEAVHWAFAGPTQARLPYG
jgi:hypothetical protein